MDFNGFKPPLPKLTKEELNKHVSDEDIIYYYFGEFTPNEYYPAPRGETRCSLVFDYYKDELKWRDFGRCKNPRDAVEYVIYLKRIEGNPIDYGQAIRLIYKEVDGGTCPKKIARQAKQKNMALKFRKNFRRDELDYWLGYEIDKFSLLKHRVFPCEVWFNGILWHRSIPKDPCFVYLFSREKAIWKAYRPFAPIQDYKDSTRQIKFMGNNTDNHVQGLEFIPDKGEVLFVTKSYKDVMVYRRAGYPAIAPHGENMFLSADLVDDLKSRFTYIFVSYDNDSTGITKANEYSEEFGLLNFRIPKIDHVIKDPADLVFWESYDSLKYLIDDRLEAIHRRTH